MGNNLLTQSLDMNTQQLKFKCIKTLYHFGQISVYRHELTNKMYFRHQCQFMVNSIKLKQSENQIAKLKKYNNQCPNLIQIYKIQLKNQICIQKAKVYVYFQYLPLTLENILQKRSSPFPQNQVCRILRSLLVAVKQLHNKLGYHGDITPQFIYVDQNNTDRYKIFDASYFFPIKYGYYRAQNERIYCPPQILDNVNQNRTNPLFNHYTWDSFSIGLVILYCMTLINPLIAYQNKENKIDFYYIQSLFRISLKNGYSEELLKCVRECTQAVHRPTVSQVLQNYVQLLEIGNNQNSMKYSLRKSTES